MFPTEKQLSHTSDTSIFASFESAIVSSRSGTALSSATCSGPGTKPKGRLSPESRGSEQQSAGLPGPGFLEKQGSEGGLEEPKKISRLQIEDN